MIKLKSVFALTAVLFLMASCSESLEDTYKEFAGDSKVRYLGRCSQPSVSPGWKHLEIKWENSLDPLVESVKLSWTANDKTESVILPRDTQTGLLPTSYDITNLTDANYEISVISQGMDGSSSLYTPNYGRPYTENHEIINSFTRGVTQYYRVKDTLVLFLDKWNENIVRFTLHYTDKAGNPQTLALTEQIMGKIYEVNNVNTSESITLERIGKVPGSSDVVDFGTYTFTNDRSFSTDFKLLLKARYGQDNPDDAFVNSLTELEIDYDVYSFQDILYFPNLKKLILGKNRYLHPSYLASSYRLGTSYDYATQSQTISKLTDKTTSLEVLKIANRLLGMTVDRYNTHFELLTQPYITDKGNPTVPALNYLNTDGWKLTCSIEDPVGYVSGLEGLLDNNPSTSWQTSFQPILARTYELNIDMMKVQRVQGIKVVQKNCTEIGSYTILPKLLRLKVSSDMLTWENGAGVENYVIGKANAEVTLIPFPKAKDIRYIRITISDQLYAPNYAVNLADIAPY